MEIALESAVLTLGALALVLDFGGERVPMCCFVHRWDRGHLNFSASYRSGTGLGGEGQERSQSSVLSDLL